MTPRHGMRRCPHCESHVIVVDSIEVKGDVRIPTSYYCISCRKTARASELLEPDWTFMGIDDREFDRVIYSPVCLACEHRSSRIDDLLETGSCAAFDVIPYLIWSGENDNRSPFPGDRGIRFRSRIPG